MSLGLKKPYEELYPYNVKYITNPTQSELRKMALKHTPATLKSRKYGNIDKIARNKARMAKYTYIVDDEKNAPLYSHNVISPDKARKLIEKAHKYIEEKGVLIEIQGYYGLDPKYAVGIQMLYDLEGANVAGMQQILSFPREMVETEDELKKPFKPLFRLVYLPGLKVPEMPGNQAIIVDLDSYTTYVLRADYFGESKKGILRMLCDYVYQKGGLVLHAGAKAVKVGDKEYTLAVLGLSGTGKTTTTFSKQGDVTKPLQDDMVILWPDGNMSITENGCFAKTFGLKKETEPVIYEGTINKDAWLENVYIDIETGEYDFSKEALTPEEVTKMKDILILTGAPEENVEKYIRKEVKFEEVVDEYGIPKDGWDFVVWTQNGRSVIPMSAIKDAGDLTNVPPIKFFGILNRDEGKDAATPGIVKFASPEQAAGYFMLGETTKTSAAGKERGKTRSPFTQPFFPRHHRLQAIRFVELLPKFPQMVLWMMNTGYVGGDALDEKSGKALKVKIRHSSSMLEFMIRDKIVWKKDPDFGYYIVDVDHPANKELLELVPSEILNPVLLYEKQGRMDEYRNWVERIKKEREEFLRKYEIPEEIIKAVLNV